MKSIQVFFISKVWTRNKTDCTRSHEDFRSWSGMKVLISWCSNKIINLTFINFKNVDKKSKLPNFEADRMNIAEVRAKLNKSTSKVELL